MCRQVLLLYPAPTGLFFRYILSHSFARVASGEHCCHRCHTLRSASAAQSHREVCQWRRWLESGGNQVNACSTAQDNVGNSTLQGQTKDGPPSMLKRQRGTSSNSNVQASRAFPSQLWNQIDALPPPSAINLAAQAKNLLNGKTVAWIVRYNLLFWGPTL